MISMRRLRTLAFLPFLVLGCGDEGESPTGSNGSPSLSINDVTVTEGNNAVFTVTLNSSQSQDVTFMFATVAGSAVATGDFTAANGNGTVTAGNTSTTVTISTADNMTWEPTEMFSVTLSGAANASIARATGVATIDDNDASSWSGLVRPVLQVNCAKAGCHGTGGMSGGWSMGNADYATLIAAVGTNGQVIQAGNAAASNLYLKTTSNPPFGSRMPADGPPFLSLEDQEKIKDWIDQGALDN